MRLMAALLFVLSGGLGAVETGRIYQERQRQRNIWYQKLLLLQGEITYGHTVLSEIFFKLAGEQKGVVEEFFYALAKVLQEVPQRAAYLTACEQKGSKLSRALHLSPDPLLTMLQSRGQLNRKTELLQVEYYMKQVEQEIALHQEQELADRKINQALFVSSGVGIALLLL